MWVGVSSFSQARDAGVALTLNLVNCPSRLRAINTCSLWSNTTVQGTALQKLNMSQHTLAAKAGLQQQALEPANQTVLTLCSYLSQLSEQIRVPHPISFVQERQWHTGASQAKGNQDGRCKELGLFTRNRKLKRNLTAVCSYFVHRRGQNQALLRHTGAGQESTATTWNIGNSNWERKVVRRLSEIPILADL